MEVRSMNKNITKISSKTFLPRITQDQQKVNTQNNALSLYSSEVVNQFENCR